MKKKGPKNKRVADEPAQLPTDFYETLEKIEKRGIVKEGPDEIHNRLISAIEGQGAVLGADAVNLGIRDWASSFLREAKAAIYKEICNPAKKQLKDEYIELFNAGLTTKGIASVASALTSILQVVNPAFAVSTVVAFLAIWLIKVGANQWCSYPQSE